jgi:Universal stress protein family
VSERVVVGWDGTAAAAAALDWALRHDPGCRDVELVVVDEEPPNGRTASAAEAADRVRATHPGCTVAVTTEHGSPAAVLAARSGPGTLLVLGGADPRGGRHRSSTAYRVAAQATGPVVMVPEGFDHGRDVVLGVGDSPASPDAALAAADQASRRGQRLVAVHAWRQFLDMDTMADVDPRHDAAIARERDALLSASLAPVTERYPSLPVARRVLHGRPVDAVLDAARTSSLLVIGRDDERLRRRGRPVTHVAMLTSRVPVLLVPRQAA